MTDALVETPAPFSVHVWRMRLDSLPGEVARLTRLLSADERERAERFRFERDRRRYIVGRGRLRELLSRYTGIAPDALCFRYGPQGKPMLDLAESQHRALVDTRHSSRLTAAPSFNLSNADDLAVYAVTNGREIGEVGIDLEQLRPIPDAEQIAQAMFASAERDALLSIPAEQRDVAFLRCWVRKEAYLKACGGGLSVPLDAFAVSLAATPNAGLLHIQGDSAAAAQWRFITWRPTPTSLAALAAHTPTWHVIRYDKASLAFAETLPRR